MRWWPLFPPSASDKSNCLYPMRAAMTKDDIHSKMIEILQETFDIEPARVRPESRLYDDLDIDSIDAVDLIVRLRPLVGRRLQPEAFKSVRTVQDVVDALYQLMNDAGNAAAA